MNFRYYLDKLFQRLSLQQDEAFDVLHMLAIGEANPAQMASFMTVYLMRPITPEELGGFRKAMLELCIPVSLHAPAIDVCGTGGDGKNTFNISTTAAFVVAGAGQLVAKHGNYGVSSTVGSSTVMETLGYRFTDDLNLIKKQAEKANITFLHAPLFHPAMRYVAPVRKELGTKTFFNMLGPLVNPAKPEFQLNGVFNLDLARLYAYLLQPTPIGYGVLHGLDGYDEVSLTGPVKYISREADKLVYPADFGAGQLQPESLATTGGAEASARRLIAILKNESTTTDRQVVVANAALALVTSHKAATITEAVALADESLASGAAYNALRTLLNTQ